MVLINDLLYIVGLVVGIYILIRILRKTFFLLKKKRFISRPREIFLTTRVKAKAEKKFRKLFNQFKKKHQRKPTRNELFRIIINASPITIRRKGSKGHWGRQKVRKYLLEKNNVVENYIMR